MCFYMLNPFQLLEAIHLFIVSIILYFLKWYRIEAYQMEPFKSTSFTLKDGFVVSQ